MNLLFDTHALIWWFAGDARYPLHLRQPILDGRYSVTVSAATAWEIATKFRLGKLPQVAPLLANYDGYLASQAFEPMDVTTAHALLAGRLPQAHRDPFDRMLIAQALKENLTLVSNEAVFDDFGVARVWD